MASSNAVSKVRGQQRSQRYPQPEGNLGDVFLKFGKDLGEESYFGELGLYILNHIWSLDGKTLYCIINPECV